MVAKIISDRFMDLTFNGPSSGSCSTFGITACYLEGRGGGPAVAVFGDVGFIAI